ncbi:MAG: hypothetical protein ACXWTR_02465 [Methylotenera sp.]
MDYFTKLPGFSKSPSGLEWVLFKKIPIIFAVGTIIPGALALYLHFSGAALNPESQKIIYQCLGFIFSYWFFVGTITFGCVIVMIMKGPAYVADPYELPQENINYEENS